MGAFFDLGNTWGRLRFFAGLLNEYVFGSLLPLLALALVLLGLTLWTRRKTAGKRRMGQLQREEETVQKGADRESFAERHRTFLIPAAATAGYFAVVAKTALLTAEEANRYQIPIYGMLLMLFVTGLLLLSQKVCGQKAGLMVCGGLTVLLAAGELLGLMRDKVLFLYEEDAPNIAFAKENKAVPTVYFYNGNLMWMIWDESLELMQYDDIYFVNMANTEPVSDEKIHEADRVLAYLARNDASEEALRALEAGMAGTVRVQKIRELLYCDLYELTANGAAAN